MPKTAKADGVAVSNDSPQPQENNTALVVTGDGDVSGPLAQALTLSTEKADDLMLELQELLHQVTEGFGTLTKPGDVYSWKQPFDIIDAITIPDFEDKRNGEIVAKHIFKLEFEDGRVVMVMQSDARPRRVMATFFQKARALGRRFRVGPYLYTAKEITGQIQPAYIFEQQPGFSPREV